jgi:hypothetical protein
MTTFEYIIFIAGLIFISMCIGAIAAASGCKFGNYVYKKINGEKE